MGSLKSTFLTQILCKQSIGVKLYTVAGNLYSGIYIALYPDVQRALQHFVGDFARLLILAQIAAMQFTILLERIV